MINSLRFPSLNVPPRAFIALSSATISECVPGSPAHRLIGRATRGNQRRRFATAQKGWADNANLRGQRHAHHGADAGHLAAASLCALALGRVGLARHKGQHPAAPRGGGTVG